MISFVEIVQNRFTNLQACKRLFVNASFILHLLSPGPLLAFGAPFIDSGQSGGLRPIGITEPLCNFTVYNNPSTEEAELSFNSPRLSITTVDGTGWSFGSIVSYDMLLDSDILTQCPFDSVIIQSQSGADNGSYSADDYIGVTFIAQPTGDTQTYQYTIAMQGASSTSVINTRTVYTPPNVAPIADAGSDQSVVSGTLVALDGSGSNDSDGTIASYAWSRTGGTGQAGSAVLSDASAARPTFTDASLTSNDTAVTHVFELIVTDNEGATSLADSVTVTITPPADTEPPVIDPIDDIAVDTDAGVNTASVALTATVTDNSGETIVADFLLNGAVIASPYDFPVGATAVSATARDSSGNAATPQTFEVFVTDTTPPNAPVADAPATTSDGQAEVSGTAEPGSTVTVTFPDGSAGTVTAAPDGSFAVTSATPQPSGTIRLVAVDPAANTSAENTISYTGDDTRPTITISALSRPTNGTYSAEIVLSEASTDFDASDLTLTNATASLSGAGTEYTVVLTPISGGTVAVSVAANRFRDAAGNGNEASNVASAEYDGTSPTARVSASTGPLAGNAPFAVTISFSEDVTGFTSDDIGTVNAAVVALSGSGSEYEARLRSGGAGRVQVFVPANAAVDAAGNGNVASNTVTIEDETVEQTQKLIATFLQNRANQLVHNQPDLVPFLSGNRRGRVSLIVTKGAGSVDLATAGDYPVWAQVTGSWTRDGESGSTYTFAAFGGHQKINPNLLVGATLQLDHFSQETGAASVSGSGWMAGPYFVAKSPAHPLYVAGRLLYGETSNEISPFGIYTDNFHTTRMLAGLTVAGDLTMGWTSLSPFLDASYAIEDQHIYRDSLGNSIPDQTFEQNQVELGLDVNRAFPVSVGTLDVWGGVSSIWSYTGGSSSAASEAPDFKGSRARLELGFNRELPAGQTIKAATFYDGIGADGFESYGLSIGYERAF